MSYSIVGQHGGADPSLLDLPPAPEKDTQRMLGELARVGYKDLQLMF